MASRILPVLLASSALLAPSLALAQAPLPPPALPLSNEQITCVQPPPGTGGSANKGCTPAEIAAIATTSAGNALPHAANNAALAALSPSSYAAVIRDGVVTPGDTAPQVYFSSPSPCSLGALSLARRRPSPAPRVAGAGDGALQIAGATGGCWILSPTPKTPVSAIFGAGVGSADQSASVQTLLNDMKTLGLRSEAVWDGQWTACFTLPPGVTLSGLNSQMTAPVVGGPGSSYVQIPAGHPGSCVVQSGSGLQTSHIHDLAIVGSLTPVAGSIGLDIFSGADVEDENVSVFGADTCWRFRANGGEGAHAEIRGMYAAACATHYVDDDGWRELQVYGGRLGGNGAAANLNAVDFWFLEDNNAGTGPNTLQIDGQLWAPDGTHTVQAPIDIGNLVGETTPDRGFGEINLKTIHAELHVMQQVGGPTNNTSGGNGFIRTDKTVANLINVSMTKVNWTNGTGAVVPASAVDAPWFQPVLSIPASTAVTTTGLGTPSTGLAHLWMTDDQESCIATNRALDMSQFHGVSDVHIKDLLNCGTVNYTSNYGKYSASFAQVGGVEVMTVTAVTGGFGPFLNAGLTGGAIPIGGITITGDSTTPGACGGSNCTGTGGVLGVSGGTTGTYKVSGSLGTVASQTTFQDTSNYLHDEGSTNVGVLTLGGYWDGQTVPGASALYVNDINAAPTATTNTAQGFVIVTPVPTLPVALACTGQDITASIQAIQARLHAVLSPGVLVVPPGVCLVTGNTTFTDSGLYIKGSGLSSTILNISGGITPFTWDGSAGGCNTAAGADCRGGGVSDLTFNALNQTGSNYFITVNQYGKITVQNVLGFNVNNFISDSNSSVLTLMNDGMNQVRGAECIGLYGPDITPPQAMAAVNITNVTCGGGGGSTYIGLHANGNVSTVAFDRFAAVAAAVANGLGEGMLIENTGISTTDPQHFYGDNLQFENGTGFAGIDVKAGHFIHLANVYSSTHAGYGFYCGANAYDISVVGGKIFNNGAQGLFCLSTGGPGGNAAIMFDSVDLSTNNRLTPHTKANVDIGGNAPTMVSNSNLGGTSPNWGAQIEAGAEAVLAGDSYEGVFTAEVNDLSGGNYSLPSGISKTGTAMAPFFGAGMTLKPPTSAGAGGLFLCIDANGVVYKKATCP